MPAFLPLIARLMSKSTGIVGYRGIGRVFGPLQRFRFLRESIGTVRLGESRRIQFPAFDYYWSTYLWTGRPYEPEVAAIFELLAPIPGKLLIDGGANIGYWTVFLSDARYNFARTVAVEASAIVYRFVERNIALNGIDAVPVHAAIAEREGETVLLADEDHHARAAVSSTGTPVRTVSIASLLRDHGAGMPPGTLAVVKLDVEGCEIPAIKGSAGDHDFELLFLYEDWPRSGMDVTAHFLATGWEVIGVDPAGKASRIGGVEEAVAFNGRTTTTYGPSNLVACRSAARFFKL